MQTEVMLVVMLVQTAVRTSTQKNCNGDRNVRGDLLVASLTSVTELLWCA